MVISCKAWTSHKPVQYVNDITYYASYVTVIWIKRYNFTGCCFNSRTLN